MIILQNQNISKLLNFLNKSFTSTIIWVVLYLNTLTILNFLFPPNIKDVFYRPSAAAPEPFEMPLFLITSQLFVFGIILLKKFFENKSFFPEKSQKFRNSEQILKFVLLLAVFILFLGKLGNYPLGHEYYPHQPRASGFIYTLTFLLYLGSIAFIIIETTIIRRVLRLPIVLYSVVLIIIALFVFEPRFPIGTHEYAYFFGPIYEILHGKTLFTQAQSNYGFYSIIFFAGLSKMGLFTYSQLPIYIWSLYIIQYFLCFYIVYKLSRSMTLGLIALFSIITVNYYSMFVLPMTLIQYSAIRRLPAVFLIFLAYKFRKVDSPILLISASLTSFLIIDAGVQTILAVASTLFILLISRSVSLKSFFKSIFILMGSLITIFGAINLLHILFGYKPIDFSLVFQALRDHATAGLVMVPLEYHTYFWIVMLLYFASIIFWLRKKNPILLFVAQLTLFTSLYFIGRSHDANLLDISVVVLLNFFILLGIALSSIKLNAQKSIIIYSLLFIIFIIYPTFMRRFTLTELVLEKYSRFMKGHVFEPEMEKEIPQRLTKEKELIEKNITDRETLILARDDTYLFMLTGKKNLLDTNPQSAIETGSSMKFAIKTATKFCPEKIAVECTVFKKCPPFTPYVIKSDLMAGYILNEVEAVCKIKYKPTMCTNQLCIADSTRL